MSDNISNNKKNMSRARTFEKRKLRTYGDFHKKAGGESLYTPIYWDHFYQNCYKSRIIVTQPHPCTLFVAKLVMPSTLNPYTLNPKPLNPYTLKRHRPGPRHVARVWVQAILLRQAVRLSFGFRVQGLGRRV